MSRAGLPDLLSRYPLGALLPSMYAGDDFAQRLTAGLDTVLAAVISTLDNLPAYLDSRLAPDDFLAWLGSWVAVDLDPTWSPELRRSVVRHAVDLHRWQGTARGLVSLLWLCLGVHAEVIDGGTAIWSSTPDTDLPGEPITEILVRVWPGHDGQAVDQVQVTAMAASVCPAHLTFRVEVLASPPLQGGA